MSPSQYFCMQYGGEVFCVFEMLTQSEARELQEVLNLKACNRKLESENKEKLTKLLEQTQINQHLEI